MSALAWENYIIEAKVGVGAFSTVYRARHKATSKLVAIKAIKRSRLSKKQQNNLRLEQSILKALDDECVVQLYEIMKTEKHIYLVMEYCGGGDLHGYIKAAGSLTEGVAIHCLRQIALGLKVLADKSLIHRDLKPQNLLLGDPIGPDALPSLKLADFGLARYIEEEDLAATLCGSPTYMAPEVLSGKPYSAKADLWSVGAIFFEMLTGTPPFVASNHIELLRKMQRAPPPIPRHTKISATSRYLIQSCLLIVNPAKRISFDEFFTHPYVTYDGPIIDDLAAPSSPSAVPTPSASAAAPHSSSRPAAIPPALASYTASPTPPPTHAPHSDSDSAYSSDSDSDSDDARFYSSLAAKHSRPAAPPAHPSRPPVPARPSPLTAAARPTPRPVAAADDDEYSDYYSSDDDGGADAGPAAPARRSLARPPLSSTTNVAAPPASAKPPAVPRRAALPSRAAAPAPPAPAPPAADFDMWRQRAMEKIAQMNAMLEASAAAP